MLNYAVNLLKIIIIVCVRFVSNRCGVNINRCGRLGFIQGECLCLTCDAKITIEISMG